MRAVGVVLSIVLGALALAALLNVATGCATAPAPQPTPAPECRQEWTHRIDGECRLCVCHVETGGCLCTDLCGDEDAGVPL
jgi:hypothetical protein